MVYSSGDLNNERRLSYSKLHLYSFASREIDQVQFSVLYMSSCDSGVRDVHLQHEVTARGMYVDVVIADSAISSSQDDKLLHLFQGLHLSKPQVMVSKVDMPRKREQPISTLA